VASLPSFSTLTQAFRDLLILPPARRLPAAGRRARRRRPCRPLTIRNE
jgi:hypothetical protein